MEVNELIKVEKERDYFFDNLRFAFILLVVMAHFISPLGNIKFIKCIYRFIYLFHMPGMIFISGYFSKSSIKDGKLVKNKVLNYCLLYAIFQTIYTLLNNGKFSVFKAQIGLWYIQILVMYLLLLPVVDRIKKIYMFVISICLGLAIGLDESAGHVASLSRGVVFFPFFLMGYHCKKEYLEKLFKVKYVILSIVIFLLIGFLLYKFTPELNWLPNLTSGKLSYYAMKMANEEGILKRFALYIISTIMCLCLMIIVPKNKTFFSRFGGRTLQIFCMHLIVLVLVKKTQLYVYLKSIDKIYATAIIMSMCVGLTFLLGFKFFSYPFNFIMKHKFKHILKENNNGKINNGA